MESSIASLSNWTLAVFCSANGKRKLEWWDHKPPHPALAKYATGVSRANIWNNGKQCKTSTFFQYIMDVSSASIKETEGINGHTLHIDGNITIVLGRGNAKRSWHKWA